MENVIGIILLGMVGWTVLVLLAMFAVGLFCCSLEFIQWIQQTAEDYRQDRRQTE